MQYEIQKYRYSPNVNQESKGNRQVCDIECGMVSLSYRNFGFLCEGINGKSNSKMKPNITNGSPRSSRTPNDGVNDLLGLSKPHSFEKQKNIK